MAWEGDVEGVTVEEEAADTEEMLLMRRFVAAIEGLAGAVEGIGVVLDRIDAAMQRLVATVEGIESRMPR